MSFGCEMLDEVFFFGYVGTWTTKRTLYRILNLANGKGMTRWLNVRILYIWYLNFAAKNAPCTGYLSVIICSFLPRQALKLPPRVVQERRSRLPNRAERYQAHRRGPLRNSQNAIANLAEPRAHARTQKLKLYNIHF